jgi:predicted nucleic acid-binding protein
MVLLDTNVVSEAMKPHPDRQVMKWIDSKDPDELGTCTIVLAEVLSGLDLMPTGSRQRLLREKAEYMFSALFADRIFKFDDSAARMFGTVLRMRSSIGHPIDDMDALIAAIALSMGVPLATRNIPDFEHCGIPLINPWEAV